MNRTCNGTIFQLLEGCSQYYHCLLEGTLWNYNPGAKCPTCARPIDAHDIGVIDPGQSRSIVQVNIDGKWIDFEVKSK